MAGSRLEKVGSILTRMTGLLQSKAIRYEDRPLWYDVYNAFPPKVEPRYDRPVQEIPIRPIFYQEDIARAQFVKKYGIHGTTDMLEKNEKSLTERFVEKYLMNLKSGSCSHEEAFSAAESSIETQLPRKAELSRNPVTEKEELQ